jgi:predicted esterase
MLDIDHHHIRMFLAWAVWFWTAACGPRVVQIGIDGVPDGPAAVGGSGGEPAGGNSAGTGQLTSAQAGEPAAAAGGSGSVPSTQPDAGVPLAADAAVAEPTTDPSSGCGTEPPLDDSRITLNGTSASYLLDLATGYDANRPYPLIISFRGAYVTAASFSRYLDLPAVVGADGIVVNMDCADGAGTWDTQRDIAFFDSLVTKLEANYCIDRRRIFVVGHATGAFFASALVCMREGLVRGLGVLSGAAPSVACAEHPAVWLSQGNADPNVELGRASRDYWVQQNGCNPSLSAPVEPAPCVEYQGCEMGRTVRYCEYDGTLDLPSFAAPGVWSFLKAL